MDYFIVDVFAEEKYAGNPLAVFTDAGHLTTAQMQAIAKEINYSETTFILSSEQNQGGYDVRIFTPVQELPFAGHPTLGTVYILQQRVIRQPVETVTLNLAVGPIPVTLSYQAAAVDVLWMRQNPPTFGATLTAAEMAPILGLDEADCDRRFPIQTVSTGVPFIIVPLTTLAALQRIKVNPEQLFALIDTKNATPLQAAPVQPQHARQILVFCPEVRHPDNQLSVRVFAHALGIPEDPATGSANGCLASYLAQHQYFGQPHLDIRVEQGYEIQRPALLFLKAQATEAAIAIAVGGHIIPIAQGTFF